MTAYGFAVTDSELWGGQGGGISNYGTVNINGGLINNCNAKMSGGGFYNFSVGDVYGVINVNGGIITNCDAGASGGGFYNSYGCTVNFNGGVVYNNSAPSNPNIISEPTAVLNIAGGMLTAPYDATAVYPGDDLTSDRGIVYGRISDSDVGITVTDFDTNESIEIAAETTMLMANRYHTLITTIGAHIYQMKYEDGMWERDGLYEPTETELYYNSLTDRISIFSSEEGEYTLIFAAFDEDGAFKGVKTQALPFPHGAGGQTVDLKNIHIDTDNYDTLKIMLWSDIAGMTPLCDSVVDEYQYFAEITP